MYQETEESVWDYRATFYFSLSTNSPRVISSGESFIRSPSDWANIPWLLWCVQGWAGVCGGDLISGSLGFTWPRSCRACSSDALRLLLPAQSGSRRNEQTHCMAPAQY